MSGYHDPEYWKKEKEKEESSSTGEDAVLHPCMEEGCTNVSPMGWCLPCRQKEAMEHQAKVDAYLDELEPCNDCGSRGCMGECLNE